MILSNASVAFVRRRLARVSPLMAALFAVSVNPLRKLRKNIRSQQNTARGTKLERAFYIADPHFLCSGFKIKCLFSRDFLRTITRRKNLDTNVRCRVSRQHVPL